MPILSAMSLRAASLRAAAVLAIWPLAACSSSGGESAPVLGASGGAIEFATGELAGFRLEVPSGALSESQSLRIARASDFDPPAGFVPVGPAISLFDGVSLARVARVRMPLDQVVLAASRPDDVFLVTPSGATLPNFDIDVPNGGAWFELQDGGVYRPAIQASTRFDTVELFPLGVPIELDYQQGVRLTVGPDQTPQALVPPLLIPNDGEVLSFQFPGNEPYDFQFRREMNGDLSWVGRFDRNTMQRFVANPAVLFARGLELPGAPRSLQPLHNVFLIQPPSTVQALGPVSEAYEVEWTAVGDVTTPFGTYSDCYELRIEDDGAFRGNFDLWVLTLAPDVGVIRIQRPFSGIDARLVGGMIDGIALRPPGR